jgi:hypothetical protein
MALFEFDLFPVESIQPWGESGEQKLHWFALTLGTFRISAGEDVLLRYTPEIRAHWGMEKQDADYQLASFARDVLGSVAAGTAPLPALFQHIASDPDLRTWLGRATMDKDLDRDLAYRASRWIGERSPWFGYLVACPDFSFLRVANEVHIEWDNTHAVVDGIHVWAARRGTHVMRVDAFLAECRSFADRLLTSMDARISSIEAGDAHPQVVVDTIALREQHRSWQTELAASVSRRCRGCPTPH